MQENQLWTMPDENKFFFREDGHVYTLNGYIIPSVTEIIRTVTAQDLSHIPLDVLQQAVKRGTAIHEEVETGFTNSLESKWIEKQINRSECIFEKMFYCKHGNFTFAGTADIIGSDTVYDVKTQSKPDIFMWTLQLNLYNLFFKQRYLKVLHTPKNGNYKIFDIPHLTEGQINELIAAYKRGRTIGDNFMSKNTKTNEAKEIAPVKLELEVYKQNIGELTTNAKELKSLVEKKLAHYAADNYSEENIDKAKEDKAELNKAAKALNGKRIEIEKSFMKPIEEFKTTVKETVGLIEKCSAKIDAVVKEVEAREKAGKKAVITEYFYSLGFELVDIEKIFNEKWLNKTCKLEDAQKEITEKIEKIKSDLNVLERIGETEAKNFYLSTLNLDMALAKADEIKANHERLAKLEAEKAAEAERAAAQQAEVLQEKTAPEQEAQEEIVGEMCGSEIRAEEENGNKPQDEKTGASEFTDEAVAAPAASEKIYTVSFSVQGTESQLNALQDFMDGAGIKYEFK